MLYIINRSPLRSDWQLWFATGDFFNSRFMSKVLVSIFLCTCPFPPSSLTLAYTGSATQSDPARFDSVQLTINNVPTSLVLSHLAEPTSTLFATDRRSVFVENNDPSHKHDNSFLLLSCSHRTSCRGLESGFRGVTSINRKNLLKQGGHQRRGAHGSLPPHRSPSRTSRPEAASSARRMRTCARR